VSAEWADSRMGDLVRFSPDGIAVTDRNGVVLFANPAAEALLDRGSGGAVGRHLGVPVEGSESAVVTLSRAATGTATVELRFAEITWEGEPAFVVNLHDITARKTAEEDAERLLAATHEELVAKEQEARAQRDFAENIVNTAQIIILVLDPQGRIVTFNPYMETLSGYALQEVQGRDWFGTFLPPHRRPDVQRLFFRAIGGRPTRGKRDIMVTRGGRELLIEWNDKTLERKDGTAEGLLCIGQDVTEKRSLQASLAQSERLASMGMLAAGIAHEINNPLSFVLYNLESLSADLPRYARQLGAVYLTLAEYLGEERARQVLGADSDVLSGALWTDVLDRFRDALNGTRRIKDIARGLGTFSRVEKDQTVPVSLRHVIEVAINMAFNEIKYRARVVKDYGRTPMVMASEGRLSQVFLNLIINATHAINEGDVERNEIRVRTWAEDEHVFAEVRDTGCGIPKENLDKLFEPFFTTKKIGVGSGLGLAISKSIVEGYGGTISAESEVGEGTCFTICLPHASMTAGDAEVALETTEVPDVRGRILIVDDEDGIRAAMARMLREHETVQAASGTEARQILERDQAFDVILCDIMMSDFSGVDLHLWLTEKYPILAKRLIFITGGTFTPRTRDYLARVDNLRLEKPFDFKNFQKIVRDRIVIAKGLATP